MNTYYQQQIEFKEFLRIFSDRYVYDSGDGRQLMAMTTNEGLLLSKYLFRGIIDWMMVPASKSDNQSSLGDSLGQFAAQNVGETNLNVMATEEDLQALGMFLLQGLVGLALTLDQAPAGVTSRVRQYSGY